MHVLHFIRCSELALKKKKKRPTNAHSYLPWLTLPDSSGENMQCPIATGLV